MKKYIVSYAKNHIHQINRIIIYKLINKKIKNKG